MDSHNLKGTINNHKHNIVGAMPVGNLSSDIAVTSGMPGGSMPSSTTKSGNTAPNQTLKRSEELPG